jgi:hypothetical protein
MANTPFTVLCAARAQAPGQQGRRTTKQDAKRIIDERVARLAATRKRMEDRRRDQLAQIAATIDELAREEFELVSAAAAAATGNATGGSSTAEDVKTSHDIDVRFYYTDDDD